MGPLRNGQQFRTAKALKYVLIEMHLGASNNRANEPAGMRHKGPAGGGGDGASVVPVMLGNGNFNIKF